MPIYEFACKECGHPFETMVRSYSAVDEVVCPSCGSPQVKKKISVFSSRVKGRSSSRASRSAASCAPGGT